MLGVKCELDAERDEARTEGLINDVEEFLFLLKACGNHWRILSQKQCSQIYVLEKSLWQQCEERIGRALEEEELGKFCNILGKG